MCFARAADHLQTSLSAALAPLQLKKPPTPACLSRAKREKEACKHTFSKQTSYPKKKTATLPEEQQQPPKQNKIKQTKSSNSNEREQNGFQQTTTSNPKAQP
jgi:hypothetical protein